MADQYSIFFFLRLDSTSLTLHMYTYKATKCRLHPPITVISTTFAAAKEKAKPTQIQSHAKLNCTLSLA